MTSEGMGTGMGGCQVAGLVVENTFTSTLDMAGVMLPALKHFLGSDRFRPLNVAMRSPWRTIDFIGKVKGGAAAMEILKTM